LEDGSPPDEGTGLGDERTLDEEKGIDDERWLAEEKGLEDIGRLDEGKGMEMEEGLLLGAGSDENEPDIELDLITDEYPEETEPGELGDTELGTLELWRGSKVLEGEITPL